MELNNILGKVFILIILSSCCGFINAYNPNLVNDCCSVTLQVTDNTTSWGFRRDSDEDATIQISKIKFNDKYAVVQKKTDDGYFAHLTILEDGWSLSIGGTSDDTLNKKIQELGYNISKNGTISMDDIDQALELLNISGMGHFLIKSPDGSYGFCIYNDDNQTIQNMSKIGKLAKGEYLSVPNSADYFRQGNISSVTNENAIDSVIMLEGTDRWGINRKDILSYLIETGDPTMVKVYGTHDNGNLINWSSPAKPDDIIFNEKEFINGTSLPIVPGKMFIGQINVTSNQYPKNDSKENILTVNEISNDSDVKGIVQGSSPLSKTGFPLLFLLTIICGLFYGLKK